MLALDVSSDEGVPERYGWGEVLLVDLGVALARASRICGCPENALLSPRTVLNIHRGRGHARTVWAPFMESRRNTSLSHPKSSEPFLEGLENGQT
jgi:hypothetical protein